MKIQKGSKKLILRPAKGKTSVIKFEHTCLNCNAIFLSARTTAKYCSVKCKVAMHRKLIKLELE